MNTKNIGLISESKFVLEAVKLGFNVLAPIGDNCPYDFIVEFKKKFYRIQCKTLYEKEDNVFTFQVRSNKGHRNKKSTTYEGLVDYFFAYNMEHNLYVFVSIKDVGKTAKTLRKERPKNNQLKNVSYICNYDKIDFY